MHVLAIFSRSGENGNDVPDQEALMSIWASHFEAQGKSRVSSNCCLKEVVLKVRDMECASYEEGDEVLDTQFEVEEVEHALKRLKSKRAGGPDNLSPEHLKFAGPAFVNWLCQVINRICELEQIPSCFKQGIVIPAFKGKGRDPLLIKSYRGITFTSVLAKIFEILLLNRLIPLFDETGIPQITQTAYRKGVACSDSIFAGHEVISKFTLEGDLVYSCFYDLTSAFDTVEFSVLLEQLSHAGIKGKCWRIIKDWYKDLLTYVRIGSQLSKPFPIERGIRQGSVLSPVLFNLVMDPLLKEIKSRKLGLSANWLYLGAFAHADDIRTASTNATDATDQVKTVDRFAEKNGLQLSLEKCGIVITGIRDHPSMSTLAGLPVENSLKCLGV